MRDGRGYVMAINTDRLGMALAFFPQPLPTVWCHRGVGMMGAAARGQMERLGSGLEHCGRKMSPVWAGLANTLGRELAERHLPCAHTQACTVHTRLIAGLHSNALWQGQACDCKDVSVGLRWTRIRSERRTSTRA